MKQVLISLAIAITLLGGSAFANKTPKAKPCKVIKSWMRGHSAEEICSENNGSFCSTAENKGQGICYGADASFCSTVKNVGQGICYAFDGSFCSTAENTAQGICYALDDSFCSTLEESDTREWTDKLAKVCHID